MSIPKNLEEIGFNDATVKIDADALSREAMIRLFNVRNEANQLMDSYDEQYFEKGLPNTDDPGMTSMFKEFIKLEGKLLGFVSQQFLYMIRPIQVALELASLITNPKELIEKIKEIIQGINDLINDVVSFLTRTKDWFTENLLGPLNNLNIPIPEIDFSILGFDIKIPKIDNKNQFDDATWSAQGKPNPYKENESDEINSIKKELEELNKREQKIKDRLNVDVSDSYSLLLSSLTSTISLLYSSLHQESRDYFDIMMEIYEQILIKQDLMIEILDKREIEYIRRDKTQELNELSEESLEFFEEDNLNIPENESSLEQFADTISEIIDDEEEIITSVIDDNRLRSNATFNTRLEEIDERISELYQESIIELDKIRNTQSEINKNKQNSEELRNTILSLTTDSIVSELDLDKLKERKKELKDRLSFLSPASAWLQAQKELIIGILKVPINFVINLVKKLFEGITEFLEELPLPRFTKIRDFFKDLLKLPQEEGMVNIINNIIDIPTDIISTVATVLGVIPWLVVTVVKEFVIGIIQPTLPIPVTI